MTGPDPGGPPSPDAVLGIGVDAVEVDRLRRVLGRRPGLAARVFTEGERDYAGRAGDPAERLATRFAAKEATMKALGGGIGTFRFTDVEVVRLGRGAPSLALHGSAARAAARAGVARWNLSLTHTHRTAIAFVVASGGPAPATGPIPDVDPAPDGERRPTRQPPTS